MARPEGKASMIIAAQAGKQTWRSWIWFVQDPRIEREMVPGRDSVSVKQGPGQQPRHGIEDGMFAGSMVWLNWRDSAADPYEERPEARGSPEAPFSVLPFGHCWGTAMSDRGAIGSRISPGLQLVISY